MHFMLKSLATTLWISCIPVALLIIHPVLADEKIETIDLESVKKNWVDELNNTPSPNCDSHGCYNSGSSKPSC